VNWIDNQAEIALRYVRGAARRRLCNVVRGRDIQAHRACDVRFDASHEFGDFQAGAANVERSLRNLGGTSLPLR
jgi:hypothetical protein